MSLSGRSSMQNRGSSIKGRSSSLDRGRPSFDVKSRVSTGVSNKRASSEERKSVSNVPRWSSVGGVRRSSFMNDVKPKETRRLNDKTYQKEKLSELIEFLENTGLQCSFTVQKLLQMTKKDFEIIFQHFLRFLYPNYTVKKLEDEAPKLLKDLMYPFIPNKSAFIYISRSNWPQLFGVLLFLADLAKYQIRLSHSDMLQPDENEENFEKKIFVQYLVHYFHGEYENEEEKNAEMVDVFTKLIANRYPGSVEDVQQEYQDVEAQIRHLHTKIENMKSMEDLLEKVKTDKSNYDAYLSKMNKRIEERLKDKAQRELVLKTKEAEIAEEEAKLSDLQSRYDAQGFDGKKQREIIREQKKGLQIKLDAKKQEIKDTEQECWNVQMETTKLKAESTQMSDRIAQKLTDFRSAVDSICRTCSFLQVEEMSELPDSSAKVQFLVKSNPAKFAKLREQLARNISVVTEANNELSVKLHDVSMKKHEIVINLKLKSSDKNQRANELQVKEQSSLESMQALENELDSALALLENVDVQISQEKATQADIREEAEAVKALKKEKQEMLDTYLQETEKAKEKYAKELQDICDLVQKTGEQINDATRRF